ncbi:MAG: hypothetical protein ACRYFU_08560 [Janthinobacterium lividum]
MTLRPVPSFLFAVIFLIAASPLTGCRNPGAEGQGQTNTPATNDNQKALHPQKVPTPPTADQIDPNSPKAVLGGTSTTSPSNGVAGAH